MFYGVCMKCISVKCGLFACFLLQFLDLTFSNVYDKITYTCTLTSCFAKCLSRPQTQLTPLLNGYPCFIQSMQLFCRPYLSDILHWRTMDNINEATYTLYCNQCSSQTLLYRPQLLLAALCISSSVYLSIIYGGEHSE